MCDKWCVQREAEAGGRGSGAVAQAGRGSTAGSRSCCCCRKVGPILCLPLPSLWIITHTAEHRTNFLLLVITAAYCSLSSQLIVFHMKLQATFRSQILGMHSTQVEQDCVVHDSSAQLPIAAGQLNDSQPGVQGGRALWSWFRSVQAQELWYM